MGLGVKFPDVAAGTAITIDDRATGIAGAGAGATMTVPLAPGGGGTYLV